MITLERIKAECEKHDISCIGCPLCVNLDCLVRCDPENWNITEIERRLAENDKQ